MSFNHATQKLVRGLHGMNIEYGQESFTTTGLTKEVTTKMGKVYSATVTPKALTGDLVETVFCDRTVTSGAVTVTREVKPYILRGKSDDAVHVSSQDWADVPLGYVPWAGTITRLTIWNKTKAGGTPVVLLGNIIAAGTKDVDDHIAAAGAQAFPADGKYSEYTTFGGAAGAAVAAGDFLILGSSGGASTAPADLYAEVEITPTPTSGLTFNYCFMGI